MSALTPLKYDNKSCCFCKCDSNKYCLIDSEYGVTKSLKSLIQQYLNVNISRTSTNSLINLCDQLPFSDKVSQNVADVSKSLLTDDKDERNVCNRFS